METLKLSERASFTRQFFIYANEHLVLPHFSRKLGWKILTLIAMVGHWSQITISDTEYTATVCFFTSETCQVISCETR